MSDVTLFYEDLQESASDFRGLLSLLQFDAAGLIGDDPGVAAPIGRHHLKTGMDRGMHELRDAATDGWSQASQLAESVSAISSAFSRLDEELSGTAGP